MSYLRFSRLVRIYNKALLHSALQVLKIFSVTSNRLSNQLVVVIQVILWTVCFAFNIAAGIFIFIVVNMQIAIICALVFASLILTVSIVAGSMSAAFIVHYSREARLSVTSQRPIDVQIVKVKKAMRIVGICAVFVLGCLAMYIFLKAAPESNINYLCASIACLGISSAISLVLAFVNQELARAKVETISSKGSYTKDSSIVIGMKRNGRYFC